jgi:peptidoglycan hydrolase-like protein with peptidoglycan-binding domain
MYMPGDEKLSQAQYDAIGAATEAWDRARAAGDRAGMDAAHAIAEAIRAMSDADIYTSAANAYGSSGNAVDASGYYYAASAYSILAVALQSNLSQRNAALTASKWIDDLNMLSLGKKSDNASVAKLQEKLIAMGFTDSKGSILNADGKFGSSTEEALKKYKEIYLPGSDPLTADMETWIKLGLNPMDFVSGIVNTSALANRAKQYENNVSEKRREQIRDALLLQEVPAPIKLFIQTAASQINNNGEIYQRFAGLGSGSAWCAAFVDWAANEAGLLGGVVPFFTSCINAGKNSGVGRFGADGRFNREYGYTPRPGDVVIFKWPDGGAHTGIVLYVDPDDPSVIYTIEGNTTTKAGKVDFKSIDQNGDAAAKKRYNSVYGYGIWEVT